MPATWVDPPRAWTAGELVTAALVNQEVRDRMMYLKASPAFTGNVTVAGTLIVTGQITGNLTGNSAGTHTGAVIGNVTGNVTGNLTGNVTGNVSGTAPAGTLTGSVLAANVVASSIASVGTIITGVWNAGAVTSSGVIRANDTNGLALGGVAGYRRLQYVSGTSTFTLLSDANANANLEIAALTATGTVTGGTYNGQTISSAASLTGSLSVAGSIAAGGLNVSRTVADDNSATLNNLSATGYGVSMRGGGGSRYALSVVDYNNNSLLHVSGAGVLTVSGFGTHSFSAGGTGGNGIRIRNTTAGTGNYTELALGNDTGAVRGYLQLFSTTFTPSGALLADGLLLENDGAGGISIVGGHASAALRFYPGNTLRGTMHASGGFSWGDTTDPGATNARVAGTLTVGAAGSVPTLSVGVSGGGDYGGTTATGAILNLWSNTNGTGAPGLIAMQTKDATSTWYWWTDTAGMARINSAAAIPNVSNGDTVGTVIGTQTSSLDTKDLLDPSARLSPTAALTTILGTAVEPFRYKSGAYGDTMFHGVVADWSPAFAMDPDATHPNGRSFNPVSAFGYTVQALKALAARLAALEAK